MQRVLFLILQLFSFSYLFTFSRDQGCDLITLIILTVNINVSLLVDHLVGCLFYATFKLIRSTTAIDQVLSWNLGQVFKGDGVIKNFKNWLVLLIYRKVGIPFKGSFLQFERLYHLFKRFSSCSNKFYTVQLENNFVIGHMFVIYGHLSPISRKNILDRTIIIKATYY